MVGVNSVNLCRVTGTTISTYDVPACTEDLPRPGRHDPSATEGRVVGSRVKENTTCHSLDSL